MVKSRNFMTEEEMENYLIGNGYEIFVGDEKLLDSTLVIEHAIELGYESKLNRNDELEFYKGV